MARRHIARCLIFSCRNILEPLSRSFHSSIPASLPISLPVFDVPLTALDAEDSRASVRTQKLAELRNGLSGRVPNPSRVWALYLRTVDVVGSQNIPLELHQQVLRKCTSPSSVIRVAAAQFSKPDSKQPSRHIHEERFRTVIRNIRAGGWLPSLEDYHVILGQFASAGHHTGSMNVYHELVLKGPRPSPKTFGLCLQAIAHRLTQPCPLLHKPRLISDTRNHCADLLKDMAASNVSLTPANLDLLVRILKETLDPKAFESLLKIAYGFDLMYPDCVSVTHLDNTDFRFTFDTALRELPAPHPFSTSALNTVIDMMGRFGNVSKLVLAFETLTQPLPTPALQRYSSLDDDDGDSVLESAPEIRLPSATPNTTTYNILLKYISRAGHAVFARHYLLQAMELEWRTDRMLRGNLMTQPVHEVAPPHFAVNRGTLLSVFGESNRDKNTQLMRWLSSKLPTILRRKRLNLAWHNRFRTSLWDMQLLESSRFSDAEATPATIEPQISASCPSSSSPDIITPIPIPDRGLVELDLDTSPTRSTPVRHFDIDTHLKILRRDLEEIESFAAYVHDVLGRTTQRVKERLSRRVWQHKDIYLLSEDKRRKMPRSVWREKVNFKPRYGLASSIAAEPPKERAGFHQRRGWIAGHRGLSTRHVSR